MKLVIDADKVQAVVKHLTAIILEAQDKRQEKLRVGTLLEYEAGVRRVAYEDGFKAGFQQGVNAAGFQQGVNAGTGGF